MASLDSDLVRHALKVARQHGFAEVEIGLAESSFRARLDPAPRSLPAKPVAGAATEPDTEPANLPIKATLVGYYQDGPQPLISGQTVRQGEVVAVIEALGLANDVECQVAGEVVEVLVHAGDPVQYGQVIATVKP